METRFVTIAFSIVLLAGPSQKASADIISFLVDPTTIDSNSDGFITGSEFQPVGNDGTVFNLLPTNNLVGADRFLLSATRGLHFGGGGGSTLSFDFSVSNDISLESYTLASSGFFLSNPLFNILEGATVLSSSNTSNNSGDTHSFNGGPLSLSAGTTYSFATQVQGAGVQAYMESWTYTPTAVPEPGSMALIGIAGLILVARRRRR